MISAPARDSMADLPPMVGGTRFPTRRSLARRLAFAVPAIALPAFGTWLAAGLTAGGPPVMRAILLALLFGNLLYLALTGWPGVLGACARLLGQTEVAHGVPTGRSRTAILFPVFNEDPQAVFAAVEVMARSLVEAGPAQTDIFVLSDSRRPRHYRTGGVRVRSCQPPVRRPGALPPSRRQQPPQGWQYRGFLPHLGGELRLHGRVGRG